MKATDQNRPLKLLGRSRGTIGSILANKARASSVWHKQQTTGLQRENMLKERDGTLNLDLT